MLTCIILNYNDATSVLSLYNKIKSYTMLDHIIIVDGASTDNSYETLKKLSDSRTTILLADKNGGYGYGNNIGLRYSQKLGADYALVANPDVIFSEKNVESCLKILKEHPSCAATAPLIEGVRHPAFKLPKAWLDVTTSSLILEHIFNARNYSKEYFRNKSICKVDILCGSLVMFDLHKFSECGLYDENVFLYNEEIIIAHKFKQHGYVSLLNLKETYWHCHSVSISKAFKAIKRKKVSLESHWYYLKNYANASWFTRVLFKLLVPFGYIEILLWTCVKKLCNYNTTRTRRNNEEA